MGIPRARGTSRECAARCGSAPRRSGGQSPASRPASSSPTALRGSGLVYPPDVVTDGSLRWLWNCVRLLPALAALALASASTEAAAGPAATPANRVTVITDSVGGVLFWVTEARLKFRERARPRSGDEDMPEARRSRVPGLRDPAPPSALETIVSRGPELGATVVIDVGYNDQADPYGAAPRRGHAALCSPPVCTASSG